MDITGMFALFMIFGVPFLALVVLAVVFATYRLKARELEVRRLEAQAKLIAAGSEVPEWLEDDPAALAEWKKAREELDRASARSAVARQTGRSL